MKVRCICSGIGTSALAFTPLGWEIESFAEIDPFASAVLKHHWPEVPNVGDFTQADYTKPTDLLIGGTPCQGFSVAGQRGGLDDPRSGLALGFCELVARARPTWVLWENVPGAYSTNGGRDFGAFVGHLAELGYGLCWRVLDAQYFGVPQRRRRIFVVGHLGDWRPAAAVLFERASLSGNPSPGGEEGQGVTDDVARYLTAHRSGRPDGEGDNFVVSVFSPSASGNQTTLGISRDRSPTLKSTTPIAVLQGIGVRRLTPLEHERLMGLPDDYTLVPCRGKPARDGPRYRAIGNGIALPVLSWIGRRINMVNLARACRR